MALGRDIIDGTRAAYAKVKEAEQQEEWGQDVRLRFHLPNGEGASIDFKRGHTIACVKLELQKLHGYPMETTRLMLLGKPMIDPLSIADYPLLFESETAVIEVTEIE
jgi:hypothetical protein